MKKVEAWEDLKGNLHKTEFECIEANKIHKLHSLIEEEFPRSGLYFLFGKQMKHNKECLNKVLKIVRKFDEYLGTIKNY